MGLKDTAHATAHSIAINEVDLAMKMAERQAEREMSAKMSARMRASSKDMGQVDGLCFTVISHVMNENYTSAINEMKIYLDSKDEYPKFKSRCARLVDYCTDLINAIKAKRSFPGIQHLAMAKQQELLDHSMAHFEELKQTLRRIERIEQEIRLEDVRSTVWVVAAVTYCGLAILVLAFIIELSKGVIPSAGVVMDGSLLVATDWLFDLLGKYF